VLETLREQSKGFLEMQQLSVLLDALSAWRNVEDAAGLDQPEKIYKQQVTAELDRLEAAMEPILAGDFMGRIQNGKPPSSQDNRSEYKRGTVTNFRYRRRPSRLRHHPASLHPPSPALLHLSPCLRIHLPRSRSPAPRHDPR
jgi:hypothetical protein